MSRLPIAALLLLLLSSGPASAQTLEGSGVRLQGLDKITARIFAFEAPLGETVSFGYLQIVARACLATPEDDVPESSAFLEVSEAKPGAEPVRVFTGWMFASSPSVSAMEHAVYDLWVVGCAGLPGQEDPEAAGVTPPPEKPGARDDAGEPPAEETEELLD